jgi:hypothetical protein
VNEPTYAQLYCVGTDDEALKNAAELRAKHSRKRPKHCR